MGQDGAVLGPGKNVHIEHIEDFGRVEPAAFGIDKIAVLAGEFESHDGIKHYGAFSNHFG